MTRNASRAAGTLKDLAVPVGRTWSTLLPILIRPGNSITAALLNGALILLSTARYSTARAGHVVVPAEGADGSASSQRTVGFPYLQARFACQTRVNHCRTRARICV